LTNISAALGQTRQELAAARPAVWRNGGYIDVQEVRSRAENAMRMYRVHLALGMRPEEAAGWAANAEAESHGDYRNVQPGGPGRGLFQWGSDAEKLDRRRIFQRLFGHRIEESTEVEQLAFRDWELANTHSSAAKRISEARTAGEVAIAITLHYEKPDDKKKRAIDRGNIADLILYKSKKHR